MTCEIPACMIDEQVDKHMEQFAYQLQSSGMKMEDYAKMMGGDLSGLRQNMRPMAETTVKSNVLLSQVIEEEKIDVTDEEVEEEYKKVAEQYQMELDKVKAALPGHLLCAANLQPGKSHHLGRLLPVGGRRAGGRDLSYV